MNTCLLHFVAFKIFTEEQTEGELMHRINAEFHFLLHLKFSLRHSNIGRFQTCAEKARDWLISALANIKSHEYSAVKLNRAVFITNC